MFLLSWSSSARNNKVLKEKANSMPTQQARSPMTQIPLFNKMKRKRSDSSVASPLLESPSPKRRTETLSHVEIPTAEIQNVTPHCHQSQIDKEPVSDQMGESQVLTEMERERLNGDTFLENHLPVTPGQSNLDHGDADIGRHSKRTITPVALREVIDGQFSLELLLKHRELRVIEQEFAKCQIALEQLRRCQIIPYPASSSTFDGMQAAITGSGETFDNRATHAPPWGVVEGPYTRHYERWLIPDSAFDDSIVDHSQPPTFVGEFVPERATRASKAETCNVAGKSRSQRGSTGARLKALPHGYPEPKEEKGPMIVKRSSDGKMVKLVCLDCRRSNFNSAQGFINHCRIAHSRQFLSHDTAIEASGEEIDVENEAVLGESSGLQASASAGLVHPLIRSALAHTATADSAEFSSRHKNSQSVATSKGQLSIAVNSDQAMSTPNRTGDGMPKHSQTDFVPFNPSPQTPHLSALFARTGRGGDLHDMVAQATTSPEIDLSSSSDEEDELEEMSPAKQLDVSQSRSTRGVLRGPHLHARITKSPALMERSPPHPGVSNTSYRPDTLRSMNEHYGYQTPFHVGDRHSNMPMHDNTSPLNLSPNTIESHTAPSLVSDDGDYENTHSESETPSSAEADDEEDHYIHAEVIDHDDMDLGEGSSHDHHLSLGVKPHSPAAGRRSSAMRHSSAIRDDTGGNRRVSFASPVRRPRKGSRVKDDA